MKTQTHAPRFAWDDRLGLTHGTVERIVHTSESWRQAQTGTLSVSDYWHDVAQQLNLSGEEVTQLERDYFSADALDITLIDYIRARRAEGFRVALLSNDSPTLADKLNTLNIATLFDPLIISAHIGVMKPDPRAYQIALERVGCTPQDAIFIDDMPANIQAAQALGIHTIHYTPTLDLAAALAPLLTYTAPIV